MAVKKSSIIQDLSRVPESNLAALEQYLDGLLRSEQVMRKNTDSLRGIWKGKGFERITHLEAEIKSARGALQNDILSKMDKI